MPEIQKAFIISPIGGPRSELRRHADWVRHAIIEKACDLVQEQGQTIVSLRSDDEIGFGHITDQVIDRIVEDRIVFVILGGDRPNCYFELGVAVAAGRPVIILKHEGEQTQFDTTNYRITLDYELPDDLSSPASPSDIRRVARTIADTLQKPHNIPKVHGRHNPLGRNFIEWQMFSEFRDISLSDYSKFFEQATSRIALQGITLDLFTIDTHRPYRTPAKKDASFFELIAAKILIDACEVSVLMMDRNNPALKHLHRRSIEKTLEDDVETTQKKIIKSYDDWTRFKTYTIDPAVSQRADGRKGTLRIVRVAHGTVHYRLSITDKEMILSPYINSGSGYTGQVPSIRTIADTALYRQIVQEYDDLIEQNTARDIGPSRETG